MRCSILATTAITTASQPVAIQGENSGPHCAGQSLFHLTSSRQAVRKNRPKFSRGNSS